ncbi:DUF1997 domain-containing protein [Acaryochloris thomasi]|nr:DUF1997 domain-containing protein [Acaryochloris thomasi]
MQSQQPFIQDPPVADVPHQGPRRFLPGFVRRLSSSTQLELTSRQPTHFRSDFVGCMDLHANPQTVAEYLDQHPEWFVRCAAPIQAIPEGDSGYILSLGRYGSFGFEVEPKIGLNLLPQDEGIYRIETITLPDEAEQTYLVDFQAALQLVDTPEVASPQQGILTKVEWVLDLGVTLFFPRFIHRLPAQLIQRTGDRLLNQVVKKISTSLTAKVQDDFHQSHGIIPAK